MVKKFIQHIGLSLAVLALLSGMSCTRQELGGGAVTVYLSSSLPETRGATPEETAANVKDGKEIFFSDSDTPDLTLLLFDGNGKLAAKYPYAACSEIMSSPTGKDLQIRFFSDIDSGAQLPQGTYSIYALANTTGMTWPTSVAIPDFTDISDENNRPTKGKADQLVFTAAPAAEQAHMPLSAVGTVDVNESGNGVAELSLRRPVAKVVVRLVNHYGDALTLAPNGTEPFVRLKNMNPNKGFVFPQTSDIPAGVSNGHVEKTITSVILPDNMVNNDEYYECSSLIYPASGEFKCDIAFNITKVGDNTLASPHPLSFPDLSILNKRGEDITSIARNQCLTITVSINKGKMLSFSFEVGSWEGVTETVSFD